MSAQTAAAVRGESIGIYKVDSNLVFSAQKASPCFNFADFCPPVNKHKLRF
jgi:hypothetical protein